MLTEAQLKQIPSLNEHYEQLKDWHWRFGTFGDRIHNICYLTSASLSGETPNFDHHLETRFEWGIMVIFLYLYYVLVLILKLGCTY